MAIWNKENLPRENGEIVPMQVPEIVSASRSTDIPAFYADWFFSSAEGGLLVSSKVHNCPVWWDFCPTSGEQLSHPLGQTVTL